MNPYTFWLPCPGVSGRMPVFVVGESQLTEGMPVTGSPSFREGERLMTVAR